MAERLYLFIGKCECGLIRIILRIHRSILTDSKFEEAMNNTKYNICPFCNKNYKSSTTKIFDEDINIILSKKIGVLFKWYGFPTFEGGGVFTIYKGTHVCGTKDIVFKSGRYAELKDLACAYCQKGLSDVKTEFKGEFHYDVGFGIDESKLKKFIM